MKLEIAGVCAMIALVGARSILLCLCLLFLALYSTQGSRPASPGTGLRLAPPITPLVRHLFTTFWVSSGEARIVSMSDPTALVRHLVDDLQRPIVYCLARYVFPRPSVL